MRYWLLVAVLLPSLCFSQTVDAPSVAKRDRPVKINHPEGAKVAAIFAEVHNGIVNWIFVPEEHFERTPTYTIFAAPPGDYLITDGNSTILRIIEESSPPKPDPPNPGPNPNPKPDPKPDPKPSPKMAINWAVWVYEQVDATSHIKQTNTRLSLETRRYLESRGIRMVSYDVDQDEAKAAPFRDVSGSLPVIVLMQDQKVYSAHPAPESLEALKALISEVSGE